MNEPEPGKLKKLPEKLKKIMDESAKNDRAKTNEMIRILLDEDLFIKFYVSSMRDERYKGYFKGFVIGVVVITILFLLI